MLASVPKTMTPALSTFFFSLEMRLTYSLAASCCGEGMLSERSSAKKTFMPSTGRSHCRPAMANTRAISTTMRMPSAVQRRQGLTCTSVFQANQITHASAGASSSR